MEKKLTRRKALKMGVTAVAAGAAIVAGSKPAVAKSKKLVWRMQTHWPTGVKYYRFYKEFAKRLESATNGELVIKALPPNAIVPTKDIPQALASGVFDIAFTCPAYWVGKIPASAVYYGNLFGWSSFEEMWFFMQEMDGLNLIRKAYAEHNLMTVGPIAYGAVTLWSKKPLQTLQDLKGFKVRSVGLPSMVFKKIGATPVYFPTSELYQSLQTGVCDGAHFAGVSAAWEMRFQEVTDWIVEPNLAQQNNGEVLIGKKSWDSLPNDLQTIIYDATVAASADVNAWFAYNDLIDRDLFKKEYNGKFCTLDENAVRQLRQASIDVLKEWSVKDPKYTGELVKKMEEFLQLTGKI